MHAALFAAALSAPALLSFAAPAAAVIQFEFELGLVDTVDDDAPAAFQVFAEGETVRLRVRMDETVPDGTSNTASGRFEDPDAEVWMLGEDPGDLVPVHGGIEVYFQNDFTRLVSSSPLVEVTGTRVFFDVAGGQAAALEAGAPWVIGNSFDWVSDGNFTSDPNDLLASLASFLSPAASLFGGANATLRRDDPDIEGFTNSLRVMRVSPLSDTLAGGLSAVPLPPAGLALAGGIVALAGLRRRRGGAQA